MKRISVFCEQVSQPNMASMLTKIKSMDACGSRFVKLLNPLRECIFEYKKITQAVSNDKLNDSNEFCESRKRLEQIQQACIEEDVPFHRLPSIME